MSAEVIGIIIFVVAVIVGPFVALRAVARFRGRRGAVPPAAAKAAEYRKDDDSSGW